MAIILNSITGFIKDTQKEFKNRILLKSKEARRIIAYI